MPAATGAGVGEWDHPQLLPAVSVAGAVASGGQGLPAAAGHAVMVGKWGPPVTTSVARWEQ